MSLLPLLFSAWWADLERPHRLMDQNFGVGMYPDQLVMPSLLDNFYSPSPAFRNRAIDYYYRPFYDFFRRDAGGTSTITADKDTFKVMLDVQQFKPDEINVKVAGRYVIVEAKHEEKKDEHGLISRQFVRRYLLPDQVDADKVSSNISSDGVLTIVAPLKEPLDQPAERNIKIEFTGKPALRPEEGTTEKKGETPAATEETTTTASTEQNQEQTTPEK